MKKMIGRFLGGALAAVLLFSAAGLWITPGVQVSAAEERSDDTADTQAETTTVTKIQAEEAELGLELGTASEMATKFVKETESNSDGGSHIKTSVIGATVTLKFEGTGIRFYTKLGNQAGKLSVQIDNGEVETIDEHVDGAAQFKQMLYENLKLSETNESHTIVLTTLDGENKNFNFDYFEVIRTESEPVDEPETVEKTTIVQAENADYVKLNPAIGSSMSDSFVVENESKSNGGSHIKTSKIGATVTLTFEGTGVRFFTKRGNGAGILSVTLDNQDKGNITEYINSSSPQFQYKLFEALNISEENAEHTLVLTTVDGDQTNFNFDYFEIISVETVEDEPVYTQSPGNTTYYLDSSAQDGGTGLSEESAFDSLDDINGISFAAGDKILIKAGSEFAGQLYPKGSGSAEAPIVIDMYGEGEKPLIDGDGRYSNAPTWKDNGPFGEEGSAVYLCNQSYWEINNLQVTNWSDTGGDKERSGIRVEAYGGGTYEHIHIKDCDIFDIRGYNGQDCIWQVPAPGGTPFYGSRTTHRTGGINLVSYTMRDLTNATSSSTAGSVIDEEPTIFNDVLIEDNTIENCYANGITTTNVRGELDNRAYRHTNVVIRNNEVRNVQRAGIIPLYTSGCLVEHNLVDTFQQTLAGYGCGIWCDRANDMVFQYNEVCNGRNTMDGMAFNLDDMTENGIIQYNYSHNNVGGGVMLHIRTNSYNRNNTVRYNLSVNDTANYSAHQAVIVCVGEGANTKIQNARVYNNTFINNNSVHPVYKGDQILFENNIFYFPNAGMESRNDAYDIGANTSFKNNVFAGVHSSSEPQNTGNNSGNISVDVSPLAGTFYGSESLEEAMEMAKLVHDSAALNVGIASAVDGVTQDFYGNAAVSNNGTVNAGIYNGTSVDEIPDKGNPDLQPGEGSDEEPSEDDYNVEYVEAEDSRVNKSTGYQLVSNSQGHGNTHIFYSGTGTFVEYTFTGKAISVYTKTGPGAGTIEILIDGKSVGVDDQYTAIQQFNKRAFTVVFEEQGTHTIRLENNGLANPSSTGNSFNIDCFKVFTEKDDNANLSSLSYTLNGQTTVIEDFSQDITEYEVTLPEGTTGTISLSGTAASETSNVQSEAVEIADGKAEAVLTVTAENGDTKDYTVRFKVEGISTVTFVTAGGSTFELQTDAAGHIQKPADPEREGYVFGGWYTDEACTLAFDFENTVVTEDLTLYAKWTEAGTGDPENPTDPDQPQNPDDQGKTDPSDSGDKAVKTGDMAGSAWGYVLLLSGAAVVLVRSMKKRVR